MAKNMPSANTSDANYTFAFSVASLMVETLKRCGDNLTRANVMQQAASYKNYTNPLLLPGITISTSATDFYPIQAVQLARFKGETWDLFGEVMHAEST
jgi:branched-chain amino acid transport system substrate-binding protein